MALKRLFFCGEITKIAQRFRASVLYPNGLRRISVDKIFDWGPNPQMTCNEVIRTFQKRNILWDKDIVE